MGAIEEGFSAEDVVYDVLDHLAAFEHGAHLGATMDALLQTCAISGEIFGTPSPELMKVL